MLVGETKCSIYPTEPYDLCIYRRLLSAAADQVSRKAAFVRKNLEQLERKTGWEGIAAKCHSVVPVVVTNLPLGPGFSESEVPVTDLHILTRYLVEGRLDQLVIAGAHGVEEVKRVVQFYNSDEEAEENLAAYLGNPPQLTQLRANVKEQLRPLIYFEGERPAAFSNHSVRLPRIPAKSPKLP